MKCNICLGFENYLEAIFFFMFEDFVALRPIVQVHAMRYDEWWVYVAALDQFE